MFIVIVVRHKKLSVSAKDILMLGGCLADLR